METLDCILRLRCPGKLYNDVAFRPLNNVVTGNFDLDDLAEALKVASQLLLGHVLLV